MISMFMIVAALLPPALPAGFMECDLRGASGTLQCFGALKEPLIFHLPKNVTQTTLKKNKTRIILNIAKRARILSEEYKNHSTYFPNGTFKLNNARRTDAGDYQLQTYGPDGKLLHHINMHLQIQASVWKPAVSQVCLSADLMNISCSSEGDAAEFRLTLDGRLLLQTEGHSLSQSSVTINHQTEGRSLSQGSVTINHQTEGRSLSQGSVTINHQTEDTSSVSSVTISLYGQLTGRLVCQVGNNVSRDEADVHLTSCEGSVSPVSLVAAAVISSVVTLLLSSSLFLCIKRFNKKEGAVTAEEENAEDEIVYSDVRVMKHARKSRSRSQHAA